MAYLFEPTLDSLNAHQLPFVRPAGMSRAQAMTLLESAPTNQQVLDAAKEAYANHAEAVDQTTLGGVHVSQDSGMQNNFQIAHAYDWKQGVAASGLVVPFRDHPAMRDARGAVTQDDLCTFFIGFQMNLDIIVGGEGGAGVGFPVPFSEGQQPFWMAYGGLRIATNIDFAINVNFSMFKEPPKEIAGSYLGIEVSAEPVEEGPEVSFGIHLSQDLKTVVGFSLGIGVALSIIPVSAAIVSGKITTSTSAVEAHQRRIYRPADPQGMSPS